MMTETQTNAGTTTGPNHNSEISQPGGPGKYFEFIKVVLVTLLIALLLKTFVIEAYRIPSGSMENTLLVGDFLIVNKLAYGLRTPGRLPLTNVAMPTFTLPLFGNVHRGDVVVFAYPGSLDQVRPKKEVNFVKRCVGLPGDTVRIVHGRVWVNGTPMELPASARDGYWGDAQREALYPPNAGYTQTEYGPVVVPKRGDTVALDATSVNQWKTFIEREGHEVLCDEHGAVYIDGHRAETYTVQRDYFFMLGDHRDDSLDSRFWGFVPDENIIGEALLVYWSWDPSIAAGSVHAGMSNIRWDRIGTIIR
jgi:signal peptidase I